MFPRQTTSDAQLDGARLSRKKFRNAALAGLQTTNATSWTLGQETSLIISLHYSQINGHFLDKIDFN